MGMFVEESGEAELWRGRIMKILWQMANGRWQRREEGRLGWTGGPVVGGVDDLAHSGEPEAGHFRFSIFDFRLMMEGGASEFELFV